MIFNPKAETVKKLPGLLVAWTVVLGIVGLWELPGYIFIYFGSIVVSVLYAIFLSVFCERYLLFGGVLFSYFLISFGLFFGRSLYFVNSAFPEMVRQYATLISMVPALAMACIIVWVGWRPKGVVGLVIEGQRIAYIAPSREKNFSFLMPVTCGCGVMLGGALSNILDEFGAAILLLALGFGACSMMVYYGRNGIRIISILLAKEKELGRFFVFWYVEDIRLMRKAWWFSRLIKRTGKALCLTKISRFLVLRSRK